jgi:hypothetical protein
MKDVHLERAIENSMPKPGSGYTEETWKRATDFLWKTAEVFYDQLGGRTFFPPAINLGPYGSINLHWDQQKFELLLSFPASPSQFPSCRGTDSYGVPIKRELKDPKDYVAMAKWMRHA